MVEGTRWRDRSSTSLLRERRPATWPPRSRAWPGTTRTRSTTAGSAEDTSRIVDRPRPAGRDPARAGAGPARGHRRRRVPGQPLRGRRGRGPTALDAGDALAALGPRPSAVPPPPAPAPGPRARHRATDRRPHPAPRSAGGPAPSLTGVVLLAFILYATWRAFENAYYYAAPYLSPFYSPCLATNCVPGTSDLGTVVGDWWKLSPALLILVFPLGFRLTCYYYRKAYYRAFWLSPPGVRGRGAAQAVHRRDPASR